MKPIVNKWQCGFYLGRDYVRASGLVLRMYCVKIKELSKDGESLSPYQYKGFIFKIRTPYATIYKTFKIPLKLRIILLTLMGVKTRDVYVFPISFSF